MDSIVMADELELGGYFFERLKTFNQKNDLKLPIEVSLYVSEMLARDDRVKLSETGIDAKTLEEKLAEIQDRERTLVDWYTACLEEKDRTRRRLEFTRLGNTVLKLCGLFYKSILRSGEGQVEYHRIMGSSAYLNAANLQLRRPSTDLFVNLAQRFWDLMFVINEISPFKLDPQTRGNELLERYLKVEDERYRKLLSDGTIIVIPDSGSKNLLS